MDMVVGGRTNWEGDDLCKPAKTSESFLSIDLDDN